MRVRGAHRATYATNCLTGVVMFPVLLVVMAIGIGRETEGMALSEVEAVRAGKLYLAAAGFLSPDGHHGPGRVHRRLA